MSTFVRIAACSVLILGGAAFGAGPGSGSFDPLVAVDRNRTAIIADIVQGLGDTPEAQAGLKERLGRLRADQLLAASLASSRESLLTILDGAEKSGATARMPVSTKILGDAARDLVYTPVTPCRLIDTRGNGAPVQGGAFTPNTRRSYVPNGLCGVPTTGVASLMLTFITQNLTPQSGGYLALLPPAAPVTAIVDIFNLGSEWSASGTIVASGTAGQFDAYVANANAHLVIDILGYFASTDLAAAAQSVPTQGFGRANGRTVLDYQATPPLVSVALGADGLPVVAHGVAGGGLKVTKCGNAACSSNNQATAYEGSNALASLSIVVGLSGNPSVSYVDTVAGSLKVLACGDAACSTAMARTIGPADNVAGHRTSITANTYPLVVYRNGGALTAARCGTVDCASGNTILTLDNAGGLYASLTLDAAGRPVIAYQAAGALKVMRCNDNSCGTFTVNTVDVGGYNASITMGLDGMPVIAHADGSPGNLKIVKCANAACSASSQSTVVTGGTVYDLSISIGADGLPIVAFHDGVPFVLKLLKCGDAGCTTGNTVGNAASYTGGTFNSAVSLTLGADGLPVIVHHHIATVPRGFAAAVEVVKCANAFCVDYLGRR